MQQRRKTRFPFIGEREWQWLCKRYNAHFWGFCRISPSLMHLFLSYNLCVPYKHLFSLLNIFFDMGFLMYKTTITYERAMNGLHWFHCLHYSNCFTLLFVAPVAFIYCKGRFERYKNGLIGIWAKSGSVWMEWVIPLRMFLPLRHVQC